jgi:hypothetical protein
VARPGSLAAPGQASGGEALHPWGDFCDVRSSEVGDALPLYRVDSRARGARLHLGRGGRGASRGPFLSSDRGAFRGSTRERAGPATEDARCAAPGVPSRPIRRSYEWLSLSLEQSRWRRDGGGAHSDLAHQGGGCGQLAAHEFRGRGLPGTPGTLEGEMTHEACTAPAARSVFSPPPVRDGDRQTSLAYGPDGPECAGSGGGRRAGIQATLWGTPCSPGRGARRRPSIFRAVPLPEPPRDFPRPPLFGRSATDDLIQPKPPRPIDRRGPHKEENS